MSIHPSKYYIDNLVWTQKGMVYMVSQMQSLRFICVISLSIYIPSLFSILKNK